MSDELKPCPFCGGKAALRMCWMDDGHRYRAVECVECGATTPGNYSEVGDQSAWDWNTRANDSLQPESVISDPDGGSNVAYIASDSREQLEADVRKVAIECKSFDEWVECVIELLDRQAAITERETVKQWEEQASELVCKVNELTAERDELRDKLREKQHVCDVQRDSFAKMEREYRELQDVCGELERTIENMRGME